MPHTTHNPFSIKASAVKASAAEIFIYGEIGDGWDDETVAARNFVKDLSALDADAITVRLNSPGGSVTDGLAIYNALKRHRAEVHVEVDGIAASTSSLIAMAGDTISMASNALLMIHAPWGITVGNSKEFREFADVLDKHASAMSQAYATGTGRDAQEFMALLTDGEDHWFTAQDAEAAGYITGVSAELPIAAQITDMFDLSHFDRFKKQTPAAAAATKPEESAMTEPTKKPAAEPQAKTEAQLMADLQKKEQDRRAAVKSKFDLFAGREDLADLKASCLDDMQVTAEQAGEKILAKLAEGAEPIQGNHTVQVVEDEREKKRGAAVDAILARAGVGGAKADRNNPYRGLKLLDMARESLEVSGMSTRGMDQMQIVGNAFTQGTSDFPVLLEEAIHKTLLDGYEKAENNWSKIAKVGSVSDFRDHNRYRTGSFGRLDRVSELGEFTNKSIPDAEKSVIRAETYGNVINLSRQMVINDDLGAFMSLSADLGEAAALTIEQDFFGTLTANSGLGPMMLDGKKLFDAAHKNIGTSGVLSVSSLSDARAKMARQKDISGNSYLNIMPHTLVVSPEMYDQAIALNADAVDPDNTDRANRSRGMFDQIIASPYLEGTRFYVMAGPRAPVLEVAFLDGNQTPYLEMQEGFDVDGTRYKVRLDYGIAAIDYRGAVTNAGA